jgi:cobalt-zinc-cadmium efflux system protein
MVWSGWQVVRKTVHVLMEAAPAGLPFSEILAAMERVPGVGEVHDLHVWAVGSRQSALACHVRPDAAVTVDAESLLCDLHDVLARYGIQHTTIQIDRRSDPHPEPPW